MLQGTFIINNTAPLRRERTYRVFHGFITTQLEMTQDVISDNRVMKLQPQSGTNKTALKNTVCEIKHK
jgi:hypothetical protein